LKIVDEHQIYRIDHYLGKETARTSWCCVFANGMFEPIWNRNHIDHIQITVDEKLGVGHRGSFYDATGALRDMVRTTCFNCYRWSRWSRRGVSMRMRCARRRPRCLRRSRPRAKPMRYGIPYAVNIGAAKSATPSSRIIARPKTSGRTAQTETYAALKLTIDNWRWAGVPFICAPARRSASNAPKSRSIQAGAVRDVSRHAGGSAVAELSRHLGGADRGHYAAVQHQGAGTVISIDGVEMNPLQGLFPGRAEHRL